MLKSLTLMVKNGIEKRTKIVHALKIKCNINLINQGRVMKLKKVCSKCGKKYKVKYFSYKGVEGLLTINYCPKCQEVEATISPLTTIKGKALRRINKKSGQVRIKGVLPEEWAKRDVIVQTFPVIIGERGGKVYAELSRGDEVIFSGPFSEGVLYSVIMLNQTLGIKTEFIKSEIKLKKGIFSSFTIKNPILIQSKSMIEKLLEEK